MERKKMRNVLIVGSILIVIFVLRVMQGPKGEEAIACNSKT